MEYGHEAPRPGFLSELVSIGAAALAGFWAAKVAARLLARKSAVDEGYEKGTLADALTGRKRAK